MVAAVPRTKPRAMRSAKRARAPKLRFSEIESCAWTGAARPGEMLEYYRGFLAEDVVAVISTLSELDRASLRKLAARAWWAAERDLVHLVQRRNGPDDFSYLAITRPRRQGALPDFATQIIKEEAA
jgi:hypothetical protein